MSGIFQLTSRVWHAEGRDLNDNQLHSTGGMQLEMDIV